MALEPDTGPHPEEPVQNLQLSWIGIAAKTVDLWVKKLLKYAAMFLVPAALVVLIDLATLYVLLGTDAISRLAEISSDPVTVIVDMLLSAEAIPLPFAISIGLGLIGLVVYTVAGGAAIKFTLDGYVGTQTANAKSSFSFAFSRLSVLIGVRLALSLITTLVGLPLLIWASWILLTFDPANPSSLDFNMLVLFLLMLLVLVPIMVYISVRFAPLLAVPIAEEHGIIESLKRTWTLSGGHFWHIFGAQFLLSIIGGIIGFVLDFVGAALLFAGEWVATPVMAVLSVIIIGPLDYVFLAVLVKDLQSRVEVQKQQYW